MEPEKSLALGNRNALFGPPDVVRSDDIENLRTRLIIAAEIVAKYREAHLSDAVRDGKLKCHCMICNDASHILGLESSDSFDSSVLCKWRNEL